MFIIKTLDLYYNLYYINKFKKGVQMDSDFRKTTDTIVRIMQNISAIKTKIGREEGKDDPSHYRINVWKRELTKAERALERRRAMA